MGPGPVADFCGVNFVTIYFLVGVPYTEFMGGKGSGQPGKRKHWALKPAISMTHLATTELAYLAGIIDGEGWISCQMRSTDNRPTAHYEIGIGTTSEELLKWLKERFPNVTPIMRKPVPNLRRDGFRKQQYEFKWRGALVLITFLEAIMPYLIIKRARAQETLDLLLPAYTEFLHLKLPLRK